MDNFFIKLSAAKSRLHGSDDGFASTYFLFMLVLLSALALGTALYLKLGIQTEVRAQYENITYAELGRITTLVIDAIRNDPSADVQDFADPVWSWHEKTQDGCTITVNPVSDRLNLNFVRKNLFDKTALARLFLPGKSSADLQQYREDNGLFLSSSAYEAFFIPANLDRYFSCYGWANINLIDEFAARTLASSLTGSDQAAEGLRNTIETLLLNRKIAAPEDLRMLLGINYAELFPFINAEPLMNINHIDPGLLRELLAYPDYHITAPEERLAEVLARREWAGITREDIPLILGIASDHVLVHYLGSVTWFWEITVADTRKTLRTVLCGLPPESNLSIEYQIIEQRYQ